MSDTVMAIGSVLRSLPLLAASSPATPLRVLCIAAVDALHRRHFARPLPRSRIRQLAAFLDGAACANAECDGKRPHHARYRSALQQLHESGAGALMDDYLARLRRIESARPPIGGPASHFDDVRAYREAVVRLSLAAASAIALARSIDEELFAIASDADRDVLFRTVMQCQIIDDMVDYTSDLRAGLPSFLTAMASVRDAMQLTAAAARRYGEVVTLNASSMRPFRAVMSLSTFVTLCLLHATAAGRVLRGAIERNPHKHRRADTGLRFDL